MSIFEEGPEIFVPRWPPGTVYDLFSRCPLDEPTERWLLSMDDDFECAWSECKNTGLLSAMAGILALGSGDACAKSQYLAAQRRWSQDRTQDLSAILREEFDWNGALARNAIGRLARRS